jgi:hypothetical protein
VALTGDDSGDGSGNAPSASAAAPRSTDTEIRLGESAPGIGPVRLGLPKSEIDRTAGEGVAVPGPAAGTFRFRYRVGDGDLDVIYQRSPGDLPVDVEDPDPSGVFVAGVVTRSPAFRLPTETGSITVATPEREVRDALVPSESGQLWEYRPCDRFVDIVASEAFSARQFSRAAWRYTSSEPTAEYSVVLLPSVVGGEGDADCLVPKA